MMTIEQKQCLLRYLGYYEGEIDGSFGPLSKMATAGFQDDYGLAPTGVFDEAEEEMILAAIAGTVKPVEPENFWEGIRYFKKDEFRCKCGGKYCNGFPAEPAQKLVKLADRVRDHFGAPAIVSSGVRCETHNAKVGGVSNSRHKRGKAMDFCVRGMPASLVLAYVQAQPDTNYAYAIDSNYVHMDVE